MKRLTTDHPDGNFETFLNYVYGKDGVAYLRSDGERDDVPLHEWAKKQCIARGCDKFPGETLEEIDEEICECAFEFPDCPVFLAYTFACQAVHLRDRLKRYEDTGLMPIDIEENQRLKDELNRIRTDPNAPMTLEELREMDGEPVWIVESPEWGHWELSEDAEDYLMDREEAFYGMTYEGPGTRCGLHQLGWLAYRRKPEEMEK